MKGLASKSVSAFRCPVHSMNQNVSLSVTTSANCLSQSSHELPLHGCCKGVAVIDFEVSTSRLQ